MYSGLVVSIAVKHLLNSVEEKEQKGEEEKLMDSPNCYITLTQGHMSAIRRFCEHSLVLHAFVPTESFQLQSETSGCGETSGVSGKFCF